MNKQSLEFIKWLAKSEKKLYDEGIEDGIMTNPRNRNLYAVFGSEEKIVERIISFCDAYKKVTAR